MSLNYNLTEIPEDVRTIVAEEDDKFAGVKKGDRVMSPVTHSLIFATMGVGIGVLNDETIPEFAARLDIYQKLNGALLSERDGDGWKPRPLTLEDIQAHKGLSTNVFPLERRAAWIKRVVTQCDAFRGVTEPKK